MAKKVEVTGHRLFVDGLDISEHVIAASIDIGGDFGAVLTVNVPVETVAGEVSQVFMKREPVNTELLESEVLATPGHGRAWITRAICEKLGVPYA